MELGRILLWELGEGVEGGLQLTNQLRLLREERERGEGGGERGEGEGRGRGSRKRGWEGGERKGGKEGGGKVESKGGMDNTMTIKRSLHA